jgi:hypothetical protein
MTTALCGQSVPHGPHSLTPGRFCAGNLAIVREAPLALSLRCPVCEAEPGQRCERDVQPGQLMYEGLHNGRWLRADDLRTEGDRPLYRSRVTRGGTER